MLHIACVDAYEGMMDPVGSGGASIPGLGLPWRELAAFLDAEVTLLTWDAWYARPGTLATWATFPVTRPVEASAPPPPSGDPFGPPIRTRSIPAVEPESLQPLDRHNPSTGAGGLVVDGDPLLLLSWLVREALVSLHAERPLDLVIVPLWGGLGYVSQLDRATTSGALRNTAFGVVVTSTSHDRLTANEEGVWTRAAIARRQREDLSLALADVPLAFGPRAAARAVRGRVSGATHPVLVPRYVTADVRATLRAAHAPAIARPARLVTAGLCDGASGVLDVLRVLRGGGPGMPQIVCGGGDTVFAPMAPRTFKEYWSSRAWVQELVEEGRWTWDAGSPGQPRRDLRLYFGSFSHLTDLWREVAQGDLVALSPTVADEVACGQAIPAPLLVPDGGSEQGLATCLRALGAIPAVALEELRQSLCASLLDAAEGAEWQRRLEQTASVLSVAARAGQRTVQLSHVLQRQRDPRVALCTMSRVASPPDPRESDTLTVVIPCFGMGAMIRETVESVWRSSRRPDEVLVVDDGSRDPATAEALAVLARKASESGAPLRIIRQPNRGLAAARNAGLAEAQGTFVSFLDGDDLIQPTYYELAVDLLRRDPGLGAVGAWADLFGDGVQGGLWNAPQPELPLLLVENQVIVPVVTRTALLRSLGGYDEGQYYNYEDWELSIRYLSRGHVIATIPRYLMRYRVRRDSLYRGMTATQNQVMRELLLRTHRPTVADFALEVAMQLEHRLAQRLYDPARHEGAPASQPAGGAASGTLLARAGQILRRAGTVLGNRRPS